MTVYAVFMEGVYRHECAGIYTSLDVAKEVADKCLANEPDDYHRFEVVPFELDKPPELVNSEVYGETVREASEVYRAEKPRRRG